MLEFRIEKYLNPKKQQNLGLKMFLQGLGFSAGCKEVCLKQKNRLYGAVFILELVEGLEPPTS